MPFRKAFAPRWAAVLLASTVLALAPASAATAADEVSVGTDGTTWSSTLAVPLFGSVIGLVPEESRDKVLWVRNSSSHDVALRITLDATTWTSADFAAAMSVGATATGAIGSSASADAAGTCRVLLTGVVLHPGESIPVTITLALGSLSALIGQNETVSMTLGVTVFETGGATAPAGCTVPAGTPTVSIPLTAPATEADEPGAPSGGGTPTPSPTDQPGTPIFVLASLADFNESPIIWAMIAVLAGGAIFYLLEFSPWRQRRTPEDDERHTQ